MYSDDKVPAGKAEVRGCKELLFLPRNLAPSQSAKFPPWLEQTSTPFVGLCTIVVKLSPFSVIDCSTDLIVWVIHKLFLTLSFLKQLLISSHLVRGSDREERELFTKQLIVTIGLALCQTLLLSLT